MSLPRIATRDEWLAARKDLLAKEKALTRQRDALNAERRGTCRWSRSTRTTRSTGPTARSRLVDLFEGRPQLIIYHFMFDPELGGRLPQLHRRHRRAVAGLPRPPAHPRHELRHGLAGAAREARALEGEAGAGTSPGTRRSGLDFNYDFGVTIDESVAPDEYNFRTKAEYEAMGLDFFDYDQPFEMPGRSCFLQVDGRVFHTYSQYARGLEIDRGLVLLPRPHRPRPPGGLGGAQGPQRRRARQPTRLRVVGAAAPGDPRHCPAGCGRLG